MFVRTIASSSNGNATYVYNEDTHLIIDCGVAAKEILEKTGRKTFDAIFVTHEHSDHIKSAGPLGRKTKAPIYIHPLCLNDKVKAQLKSCNVVEFERDLSKSYQVGSITVTLFSTKHDARYSVGLILQDAKSKFCFITDTGFITKLMRTNIDGCDSYFIETDYDEVLMDKFAGYDDYLKERITSDMGHLSNQQAVELIKTFDLTKVKTIILGHLSKNTNSPEVVTTLLHATFPTFKEKFHVAPVKYDIEV